MYKVILISFFLFLLGCMENSDNARTTTQSDIYYRLDSLGITLKTPAKPVANYVNAVTTQNNLVFMAGKGPRDSLGNLISGKVGIDLTIEQGYEAAKKVAISQIEALHAEIGDLNRVKKIVKVLGMVNCHPDFTQHPEVINGYSDMMVAIFGTKGKHARAAVGMSSLPLNIPVEIEMIVEIY